MPEGHEQLSADEKLLAELGYTQELHRSWSGFSNFAISFSIISILTGAVTLFGYGLEMGGPLEMTLGWPIATTVRTRHSPGMWRSSATAPRDADTIHAIPAPSPSIVAPMRMRSAARPSS